MLGQVKNLSEWRLYLEDRIATKRKEIRQLKRYSRELLSKSRDRDQTIQPQTSEAEVQAINLENQRIAEQTVKEGIKEEVKDMMDNA